MAPELFSWLGIRSSGVVFELVIWLLMFCAGLLLIYRELRAGRQLGKWTAGWVAGGILTLLGSWRWFHVFMGVKLYFGEAGLRLPTYGLMMVLGFVVGLAIMTDEALRVPAKPTLAHILDLGLWVVVGSLIGARVLATITEIPVYAAACSEAMAGEGSWAACFGWLKLWEGGLVFYGGFLGGLAAGYAWCKRNGIDFLAAVDRFVPATALGHAIGRVGCITAGCCFGTRGHRGLLMQYPFGSGAFHEHLHSATPAEQALMLEQLLSLPVHAAPLYEAIAELVIFLALVLYMKPRKRYHGQMLAFWLWSYGIVRIIQELFRDDPTRGFFFRWEWQWLNDKLGVVPETVTLLSTSQGISLVLLVIALVIHQRGSKRAVALEEELLGGPPS